MNLNTNHTTNDSVAPKRTTKLALTAISSSTGYLSSVPEVFGVSPSTSGGSPYPSGPEISTSTDLYTMLSNLFPRSQILFQEFGNLDISAEVKEIIKNEIAGGTMINEKSQASKIPSTEGWTPGTSPFLRWQLKRTFRSSSTPLSENDLLVLALKIDVMPLSEETKMALYRQFTKEMAEAIMKKDAPTVQTNEQPKTERSWGDSFWLAGKFAFAAAGLFAAGAVLNFSGFKNIGDVKDAVVTKAYEASSAAYTGVKDSISSRIPTLIPSCEDMFASDTNITFDMGFGDTENINALLACQDISGAITKWGEDKTSQISDATSQAKAILDDQLKAYNKIKSIYLFLHETNPNAVKMSETANDISERVDAISESTYDAFNTMYQSTDIIQPKHATKVAHLVLDLADNVKNYISDNNFATQGRHKNEVLCEFDIKYCEDYDKKTGHSKKKAQEQTDWSEKQSRADLKLMGYTDAEIDAM